ncbi:hypothetical protein BDB00DRAFT_787059 [Zychaea mexicana]|uniref:uncharacterized protein n=1 Tax=Zychaea mexicana TaxID=64656 RepID=UPI0022FF43F6|nr:uncharacterized protein BDB00DRAFT_787059 [Zychaea mexicana]KAI9494439.1 hypothetical protein BDB00DRAFT_787059 [Zychaea mexicana]
MTQLTLSLIVDQAHKSNAQYYKKIFEPEDWNKLTKEKIEIEELSDDFENVVNEVIQGIHQALRQLSHHKNMLLQMDIDNEFYKALIFWIISFRNTTYEFSLELASAKTKKVKLHNEWLYGPGGSFTTTYNVIGQKIDAIVTTGDTEIACCVWKAPGITTSVAHEQQTKNMRSNAYLCRNLNSLPFAKDCSPHVLYMDWITYVPPVLARKECQEEHEKYDHKVPESEFDTADPEIFYTPKTSRAYAATPAE